MPTWPSEHCASKALYDRALRVLPGGITRIQPWQDPFPVYASHGEGAYVVDVDGTRRVDFLNNFASLIHGHAPRLVVEAVQNRVARGTAFTLPTREEVDLAEAISSRAERLEQLRFSNSGSEAVMCAIKAARALTGRPAIVKCEGAYHGSYDFAEVSLDSTPSDWGAVPASIGYSKGVPRGVLADVIVVPFNDPAAAERIIHAERERIAAILIDASPSYIGLIAISPEFAATARRLADEIGALLILDEVISFRVHHGGAQTLLGIRPDLTVLGKIIGGGFPVGAVAGPAEYMKVFDHRKGKPLLPWSGTFTANPVTMTAGKVTLDLLDAEAIARINELGTRLRRDIAKVFEEYAWPGQVTGFASMFRFLGHRRPVTDYRSCYHDKTESLRVEGLQAALLREGFHISAKGMGFLSTAMGESEIDALVQATARVVSRAASPSPPDATTRRPNS
ncbi:MAG: aspartate aminotransferase family protein [Proteobacteria bacterium]|nr:aspartate aminotransferase family protein [Pseudomonadota bacterium]